MVAVFAYLVNFTVCTTIIASILDVFYEFSGGIIARVAAKG